MTLTDAIQNAVNELEWTKFIDNTDRMFEERRRWDRNLAALRQKQERRAPEIRELVGE